jgi:hypothetical protein
MESNWLRSRLTAMLEDFSFQFSLRILPLHFVRFDTADYSRPAPFH